MLEAILSFFGNCAALFGELIGWLVDVIGHLGYAGIVGLMFLESSFFPFPSEVVMPPAGYLAWKGEMNVALVLGAGILGSILGALFNYWIAVRWGRPFFEKYGKYFFVTHESNRGSIDFDFPESKIILNGAGRAIDVQPYEHNVATDIIEDFMLMANETVAKEYCKGEYPFVYRTHENPDPERVESLLTLLRHQGIQVQKAGEEISPKEIQEILEKIQGIPNEAMLSRLILRTMKQAKYTTECSGHFGLAAKYYCHFTSPIRRYPDLQIHRIIRDNIRGRLKREGKTEHYREILESVAEQSSICERRAQEAERESDRLKKAEYMSYHLGEEFDGIISGVTCLKIRVCYWEHGV